MHAHIDFQTLRVGTHYHKKLQEFKAHRQKRKTITIAVLYPRKSN